MHTMTAEPSPASGLLFVGARAAVIAPDHDCCVVDLDTCADETARQCADVLYGTGGLRLANRLLSRYPGCLFVLLHGGGSRCIAVVRTGARVTTTVRCDRAPHGGDQSLLASLLHAWLAALLPLEWLASAVFLCAGRTYRFATSSSGIRTGSG
ncbi:hypothetical protein ACFVFQ_20075 [Streptomyces sp. NPDC057743]|uniref:hypothetical protein n=1 Tax=Streptomyces sp. NPDC057743 TaxID=3346236 RepID=UPI00369CB4B5